MKKPSNKKLITTLIFLVILTVSIAVFMLKINKDKTPGKTSTGQGITKQEEVKYSGPTDQEKEDTINHKEEIVAQQKQTETSNGSKKVIPVITNASQSKQEILAGGYVSGILEDGGSCEFVFTKGSLRISKTTSAFANVSKTDCAFLAFTRSDLSESGEWSLVLSYNSPTAIGSSEARKFVVQ